MMGTTLHDRYRIDAEIGQGGMGTAYRAAAIKVLSSATLGTQGRRVTAIVFRAECG